MVDRSELPRHDKSPHGWCLTLYHRMSRRARRRLAAVLLVAALGAQSMPGAARTTDGAGGDMRPRITQEGPKSPPDSSGTAGPYANPAVARALGGLGLYAPAAPDNIPSGSQFQVNTYSTSLQRNPSVAMDSDGDFVVVWQSNGSSGTDTDSDSIQGQRYDSAGTAQGSQFQVNTYTTSLQLIPSVAMDADGDFVVVWQSSGSAGTDSDSSSIHGQRYDAAGTAQGSQFQVNTYTTNNQVLSSVAMDADGDFVVVWSSDGSSGTDTDDFSIQGQRYNAAGTAQGSQFHVNTYTTTTQLAPSVAMDADGDFVVAWWSYGSVGSDTSDRSIQAQRYDAAGTAQGSQFQVNTYTTSTQRNPSVGMDADGDFVVVWQSAGSGGTDSDVLSIQGQRYNALGVAQGGEFQLNTYTTGTQVYPSVAMDADGNFAAAWESSGSDGTDTSGNSIHGQRYNAAGAVEGTEFQVNTYTTNQQLRASVAMDTDGDFTIVWESIGSYGTDTTNFSIQGQRFLPPAPPMPPTAVDLRSFRAIGLATRAVLVWETASEADTLGFQVLRAKESREPWTLVGPALVPAVGRAAAGDTYVLHDAPGPGTWHYRLEAVGAGGKRSVHPAIEVRVGPGAIGSEVIVPSVSKGMR